MDSIYIYDGRFKHGDAGFPMIKSAAAQYCAENGIEFDPERAEILRDEKGKPYFTDLAVEFSLSHTGTMWMCLFSDKPCGLDLQLIRDCDHEAISRRFYQEDEQQYVAENGREGFFDIWVRKEAYCKMTGEGMFGDMPSALSDSGEYKGTAYCFTEIEISDDLKCAVCSSEAVNVEMRVLG